MRSLKILLVETKRSHALATVDAMKAWNPALVITEAFSGPAALAQLAQSDFDLILLSCRLPDREGIDLLNILQTQKRVLPVIMLADRNSEANAVEALKGGAQAYVLKTEHYEALLPLSIEKVLAHDRLRTDLAKAALRQRRFHKILLAVTKELKTDPLSQALAKGACDLTGSEKSLFLSIDPIRSEVIASKSFGMEIDEAKVLGAITSKGLLALAYTDRKPVVIENPRQHSLWEATPWLHGHLRHFLAVPLFVRGLVEGLFCVMNKTSGGLFSEEDCETLSDFADHAGLAIHNARLVEKMEQQAITDSLTDLLNHMEFQKRMGEEIDRSRRYGKGFSLLMLDLDHFKEVNDTYGHLVGDQVLQETAKILKDVLRSVDLAFRYGGEEFAVLLPETTGEGARIIADRIRQEIADRSIQTPAGEATHVSISIGVAEFPQDADQREAIVGAADLALFASKRNGRNRVSLYRDILKPIHANDPIDLKDYALDPEMKTLLDLAAVVDAKSSYTKGHTEGVLKYIMYFSEFLDLDHTQKKSLEYAGLLHNIGMASVPNRLLSGGRPLTVEEQKIIQSHPLLGEMMVQKSSEFEFILPVILYHHERYDGHGYPNGLKGDEIPYLARILTVVDAYYAMISVRSYRPKRTQKEAIAELRAHAGTQFDPKVVEAFTQLLEKQDKTVPEKEPTPDET